MQNQCEHEKLTYMPLVKIFFSEVLRAGSRDLARLISGVLGDLYVLYC